MRVYKEKSWKYETSGADGNVKLFGVNIFDCEWHNTGMKTKVRDPLYGQKFVFPIYSVVIDNKEHQFAAGEFSNCVYGFFVYKY